MDFKAIAKRAEAKTAQSPTTGGAMDFKAIADRANSAVDVDANAVTDWYQGNMNIAKRLDSFSKEERWGNPDADLQSAIEAQKQKALDVQRYINVNRGQFDDYDALIKEYDDFVGFLRDSEKYVKNQNAVYSAYANRDAYDNAVRIGKLQEMSADELKQFRKEETERTNAEIAALQKQLDAIPTWTRTGHVDEAPSYHNAEDEARAKELKSQISKLESRLGDILYVNESGNNVTYDDLINARKAEDSVKKLYSELSKKDDWDEIIRLGESVEKKELGLADSAEDNAVPKTDSILMNQLQSFFPDNIMAGDLVRLMTSKEKNIALYLLGKSNERFNDSLNLILRGVRTESEKSAEKHAARLFGSEYQDSETVEDVLGDPDTSMTFGEYANLLLPVLEARRMDEHNKWWQDFTDEQPFWAWVAARGANFLSMIETVGDTAKFLTTGESDRNMFASTADTIDSQNVQNIKAHLGDWGDFVGTLYGVGSSLGDMALTLPLASITPTLAAAAMGTEAAAHAKNAALDRGMDGWQAELTGLAAGVAETIFEKYSIGKLFDMKKAGVSGLKDLSMDIAESMVTNASEEFLTELANGIYDILVNGDFSQFETDMRMYMQQGMTEAEARQKAAENFGAQLGESALSGMLMALPLGGGASFSSWKKSSALGKTVSDVDYLVEVGKLLDDNPRIQQLTQEVADGNTKDAKLGALFNEITQELKNKGEAYAKEVYTQADENIKKIAAERAAQAEQNKGDSSDVADTEVDAFTAEDVAEFNAATALDATADELRKAAETIAAEAYADTVAPPKQSDYTPPKSASEVTSYGDAQTDKLSRKLSRNVYKYDGSNRIDAEDGFYDAKTNSIYINANHPFNRMSYATVLAHEYVHSLEIASEDYKALRDAVFASSVYARYLKSAGTGERVSLTHDQHVQQIAAQYGFDGADAVKRSEQEILAKVLARDFLRNESHLVDLARQDRNLFMKLWAWVRRMIARLGKSEETLKLEALFQKAAKASTEAHNAKADAKTNADVSVKLSQPEGGYESGSIDIYDQRSYTNFGWVVVNNILSPTEYKSFNQQLGEAVNQGEWYPKTPNGEYMFWVNDRGQQSNKVVFASGSLLNPIISKVVEVDRHKVDDVETYVEGVIKYGKHGIDFVAIAENYEREKVFNIYRVEDYPSFAEASQGHNQRKNQYSENNYENRRVQQQRGGSGESNRGDAVKHSLPDRTESQYLEKMLKDEAVAKETKAQIYADSPLYDVLHDEDRFAAAREILRNRDQLVDVVKRVAKGEAATAEEITAMILMQNAATTGAEQANASYIVATAARVAGRALRAFDRHNKLYTQMTPEDRAVALLEDTKADALQDAFRLQNRFIDYKLHRGAGDFIDQVVLNFYAENGIDQLSVEKLGEKVMGIIDMTEDVVYKHGLHKSEEIRDRTKGRLKKAFQSDDLVKYLYDLMKSGEAPIDAIRLAVNKALGINSMTNAELKTVIGYAEGIADLRNAWYETTDVDEARQLNIEIDAAIGEMYDYIAEHMTISVFERVRSWRKTAMLANARTHVRNIVANVVMNPVQRTDMKLEALLEKYVFRKYGARHTVLTWTATEHGKGIKAYVDKMTDYEISLASRYLGYATDTQTDKSKSKGEPKEEYNFDFDVTEIAMRRKMFGARENFLNKIADFNSEWLEKEDRIFYGKAFRSALGQIMVANKATEATEQMIHYARQQAMEAVFKGDGVLYRTALAFKQMALQLNRDTISGQKGAKLLSEIVDTILPFTKTPSNIAQSIFDHSVLGLAWSVIRHVKHVVANKTTDTLNMDEVIAGYAKGVQGSLWTFVGFLLGMAGFIVTDEDDDWEYDELTGGTKYALKFGDVYVSLDWLQPASASFLIGATVGESVKDNNTGNIGLDILSGAWDAAVSTFDFAMDQSYMKSLKDLFSTSFDGGSYGWDIGGGLVANYLTQFVPTIFGQTARAIDPVQRKVNTGEFLTTTLNTLLAKIPGASMALEPRTSVWGDEVRRNNTQNDVVGWISNALQQYVSPSTITGREYPNDATTEELISLFERVKESGESTSGIFNSNDMKEWLDEDNQPLSPDDYRAYDSAVRKTFKSAADELVNSDQWYAMTDKEKVAAISDMYENIRATAKDELKNSTASSAIAEISRLFAAISSHKAEVGNTDAYSLKLKNGHFLPENGYLYERYESALREHYDALVREASVGWFKFSHEGVDYKIRLNDCTPEERQLAEENLMNRARNHMVKLFEGADPAALEKALRSTNGDTAYTRLKGTLD